uniref:Uncharacterized protein n=1 Tax=Utricularia reniformis TaxID=192314 RepID=A0A1Y0B0Z7_9LAMI|nr:hypothetical protein AEK19_MT0895 [Utricularia reniformis]ART31125.1 hypothetical protein AEK19_MT0895 [Utricularia reniformis]
MKRVFEQSVIRYCIVQGEEEVKTERRASMFFFRLASSLALLLVTTTELFALLFSLNNRILNVAS